MENAWSFLQPWRDALAHCLRLESDDDLERRGVLARFECWPDVSENIIAVDKWFLRVEFPTVPTARNNTQQLQRVREAVELFDRLAAVDNAAFVSLLSEFLIHRSDRRTGTPRRPRVVWPTWELQLTGALSTGDAIESQCSVTWGQLFGCPDDPWETSLEFCAAMKTLKALGLGTRGNQHNFSVSSCWQVSGYEMLMEGSQSLVSELQRVHPNPFSREMNNLFELQAPPVAHLVAVGDKAALMKTWEQPGKRVRMKVKSKTEKATALPGLLSQPELLEMTAAIARTDLTTFNLVLFDLNEARDADAMANNRVNLGFQLSTLVCGRSLCFAADRSFPVLQRSGKVNAWDVEWSYTPGLRFGAVLSAFAEATQTSKLKLTEMCDDDMNYAPVYWAWLAYAFWSRSSRSSIQNLNLSWINLTEAHVAAVKNVLMNSFPESKATQSTAPAAFGYVDIGKGTELHFAGRGAGNDGAPIITDNYRCGACYDASSEIGVADVVVPGYGICKVALAADTTFIPDTLGLGMRESEHGIRSLSLTLADVENNIVLPRLLTLVGKGLQTLSLEFGCLDYGQVSLNLSAVASACPELKELRLRDWNVILGDNLEALQMWSIKKLSIRGSSKVDGLSACLRDHDYRMSSELVELKISPSRNIIYEDEYVVSLMEHSGEVLPVTKKKLSRSSKCAVISVVSGRGGNLQAMQYLDSCILSIIFGFAATPESRSVQVVQ